MGLVLDVIRLLALLFLVRLIMAAVSPRRPAPARETRPPASVDLVRDRVCNTFLPRSRAVISVVAGKEEAFCSVACAARGREGVRAR